MRKLKRNQKELIESTSTETTPYVAVDTAGVTGEEHFDRSKVNEEADSVETANEAGGRHRGRPVLRTVSEDEDHTVGDDHHARYIHLVIEAGSIVLQVSNNMSEGKKDGEEAGETTAAKEPEEISKKDVEFRRLVEERRRTPKEEKQRLKEVSKCIKKCIRDKK